MFLATLKKIDLYTCTAAAVLAIGIWGTHRIVTIGIPIIIAVTHTT
jgi:hypothetical protein